MLNPRVYEGGKYLDGGDRMVSGSVLDGTLPINLYRNRSNTTLYDPELVLAPDEITDAAGRFAAFCAEGFPVWGYTPVDEIRVADLGAGAGNFLVSLIDGLKQPSDKPVHVQAIDTDQNALQIAQLNIDTSLGSLQRPFTVSYEYTDYREVLNGSYRVIYFNPPYLERGHNITHSEAALAPAIALYSENPTDEYEQVVPVIRQHVFENGIAIIRLPRVDEKIDEWVRSYMERDPNSVLSTVTSTQTRRVGRFLLLLGKQLPTAISEYDYFFNYLGGSERRERAKSDLRPIYHDEYCELSLLSR